MRQELIDTIWNWFTAFFSAWGDVFWNFGSWFMSTPFGWVINFIKWVIQFVYFGVKSVLVLIWNLRNSIVGGAYSVTWYLSDTFEGLSVFLGVSTSTLVALFELTLILIVFWFIVRVFLWKFHYNVKTKK